MADVGNWVPPGTYAKPIKRGWIYRMDGSKFLWAEKDIQLGETVSAYHSLYKPDMTRPEVGEAGDYGLFWGGQMEFKQDG